MVAPRLKRSLYSAEPASNCIPCGDQYSKADQKSQRRELDLGVSTRNQTTYKTPKDDQEYAGDQSPYPRRSPTTANYNLASDKQPPQTGEDGQNTES